ncbi:hypothetical protein L861_01270 [Litchfieldella anticariensis FP35 = DSM 16096]|uniref:Cytochrome c domain-containing protein n=1 Tax=Litchfieldella anticariensis (strain DSM 16096 / CECT 5854 / CIP 108499 / LMG 22089 / FP35) TaxID=1121939 RepID=S2KQ06_LITA3|nr:c-type cytochrome [Halomonas anticariensis]EPC03960.1 hypothetical protein L861_01270 [Halomonas anticariensis FP35 = DSM 16096]
MKHLVRRCQITGTAGLLALAAIFAMAEEADQALIERGRYLITISGCNDCHTPNYAFADGQVPEELWLTGDILGWYGAWGTTYAANLRLLANSLDEGQWVTMTRTLKTRPPMPWFNLNHMSEEDSRAMYHYIRSLGPAGESAPTYQPPGSEPASPYVAFPSMPSE